MAQAVYSETKTHIDIQTGQVVSEEKTNVVRLPQEPEFIKLYLADINKIFDLPKGCSPVLYEILKKMNYEGQIILNKFVKEECAKAAKIALSSFNNCLTDLVKKDILKRLGTGTYMANPHLFGKGSWVEISKQREFYLTVKYSSKGKEIVQTPPVQNSLDM